MSQGDWRIDMFVREDALSLIGNTPIVRLSRLTPPNTRILLKLEYLNPSGSHKDRIALYMIRDAEEKGLLRPGGLVVEESSGNTGIAVAMVAKLKGYRAIIVVPRGGVSKEKIKVMRMLGARIVEGSVNEDDPDYVETLAEKIAREENGVFLHQAANKANIKAHFETTGPEIWAQTRGQVDAFVMGVGTGGTITGVGRFLKMMKPDVRIVAVTPKGSALSERQSENPDRIEGLASGSVPENLDRGIVDEVIPVGFDEALSMARRLASEEGILAGISTGAHLIAALKTAEKLGPGRTIVTIAADSILRYVSLL